MNEKDLKNIKEYILQTKKIKDLLSELEEIEQLWEYESKKLANKEKNKNPDGKTDCKEEKI